MDNKLEIESIWEDESLFEVKVYASNGLFSGTSNCYTNRKEIEKLSNLLAGYPKSLDEVITFSTGESDTHSYFSLNLKCIDMSGHITARVKIAHIVTFTNSPQENFVSEFNLIVEPASIDTFSKSLNKLSKSGLGEVKSVLNAKT